MMNKERVFPLSTLFFTRKIWIVPSHSKMWHASFHAMERSPLNRSRRWRPTYQHAVSKLGNGVRVFTFSRFSMSFALRENQHNCFERKCRSNGIKQKMQGRIIKSPFCVFRPHLHLHAQVVDKMARECQAVNRCQNCIDPTWTNADIVSKKSRKQTTVDDSRDKLHITLRGANLFWNGALMQH